MRRYRTEIVIPPDRTLVIQLPEGMPDGPATLIVQVGEASAPTAVPAEDSAGLDSVLDLDRGDIEWWEEFDDEDDDQAEAGDSPKGPAIVPPGTDESASAGGPPELLAQSPTPPEDRPLVEAEPDNRDAS